MSLGRHLGASLFMVVGGIAVLGLVYVMNEASSPPPKEVGKAPVAFEVERTPPKKKPKPKRKKRQKAQRRAAAKAPAPKLSSNLGGPSFDLPQFEMADLSGHTKTLLGDHQKSQVFTADTVDERPKALAEVAPEIPRRARRKGITGFVSVRFLVDAEGKVKRPRVVNAEPEGLFEQPVIAALEQWSFEPARYGGAPVKVAVTKTFRFN